MIFDKIIPRLLLGFLLLSPIPMAGLAWLHTQAFERSLQNSELDDLSGLADKKSDQINTYLDERLTNSRLLAKSANTLAALQTLAVLRAREGAASPRYRAEEQRYREYFRTLFNELGFYDLLLSDAAGNVVLSILHESDFGSNHNTGPYRDGALASAHREAIALLGTQISLDKSYAPSNGKSAIFFVVPVLNAGKVSGTLALQLYLDKLTRVAADTTGPGETGETALAQRDGGDVREFSEQQAGTLAQLDALLQAGENAQAASLLHGIKGIAANLGVTALTQAAESLEREVKAGIALNSRQDFAVALKEAMRIIAVHVQPVETHASATLERQLLSRILADLLPYLREQELVPEERMQALHQIVGIDLPGAPLARMSKQIDHFDHFDHDGALVTIAQIAATQELDLPSSIGG